MRILSEEKNPLLKRRRISFEIDHPRAPTPSRFEVLEELSSHLDVPEDRIVIDEISTPFGSQVASGVASVYDSKSSLEEIGSKHLIERQRAVAEKTEGEVEEAGEEVEVAEEPEEGPEQEEEESEETPEEKTSKEGEESEDEVKSEEAKEEGGSDNA